MNYAVYIDRGCVDGRYDLAGTFFDCDNVTVPHPEHLAHEFAAMVEFDYGQDTYIVSKDGRTDFPSAINVSPEAVAIHRLRWRADNITEVCEWCRGQADEAAGSKLRAVR